MEEIIEKVKPVFQKYDEQSGNVTTEQARTIIEELQESSDESYKMIFKSKHFPKNQVRIKDIAYWIDAKNRGTGPLALVPIFGYRSIDKAKETMSKYGFEISSSGGQQNIEGQVGVHVGELANKETQAAFQVSVGGKEHEVFQELGIQSEGAAVVFKIKCKDPYSGATKIEELLGQGKELASNMIPPKFAEIIDKLSIKASTVSNDYVAVQIYFPSEHLTEIAKQQKELVGSFMGEEENQFLIDFDMQSSMNLKKLQEDHSKPMSEVLFSQNQAWKALLRLVIPGAFASNAKKLGSLLLEKFLGSKLGKYKKMINLLTPVFLLQSLGLELNFNSFNDLLKKSEDSELLEELLDSEIKNNPKEFKEFLNDDLNLRETIASMSEGMPIAQEIIDFFKENACLDFELIVKVGVLKVDLLAKSEGLKEWFEFVMKEDEEEEND